MFPRVIIVFTTFKWVMWDLIYLKTQLIPINLYMMNLQHFEFDLWYA